MAEQRLFRYAALVRPALLRSVAMMAGVALAGWLLLALPGGPGAFVSDLGKHGAVAFVIGSAVLCAVGFPRQVVAYAGAFAFGLLPGIGLALAAQVIGCTLDVAWARLVGREWARGAMQRRFSGRLARLDAFLSANPFSATLMLRLLPVGNNLALNLIAGISGIPIASFIGASAIGYVPQTLAFALVASGTRIEHGVQLALGVALFAISAILGALLLKRVRRVAPV